MSTVTVRQFFAAWVHGSPGFAGGVLEAWNGPTLIATGTSDVTGYAAVHVPVATLLRYRITVPNGCAFQNDQTQSRWLATMVAHNDQSFTRVNVVGTPSAVKYHPASLGLKASDLAFEDMF